MKSVGYREQGPWSQAARVCVLAPHRPADLPCDLSKSQTFVRLSFFICEVAIIA